jgi:hypothetical protein
MSKVRIVEMVVRVFKLLLPLTFFLPLTQNVLCLFFQNGKHPLS